ncbi:MAG: hypothetical protein EZS28_049663, partial [Streblomastix strix]
AVVRTIRNAFEKDPQQMANNKQLQQVVDEYNNTKRSAFKQKFSRKQVNENEDLEGIYIRQKIKELADAKELQYKDNLQDLKKGNIITIHLDLKKTANGFEKQRRQFNEIATFIKFEHGNVICELLKPYNDIKIVEVPIYYTENIGQFDDA